MTKPSAKALAQAGFRYIGTPYSTMDCQAFVERCMKDVGVLRNLPGSNAWYRAMSWTGTPEECKARFGSIPDGAFLFILEQDGKEPAKYRRDGIGNASHIGIKTGKRQGAIHSSSSRGCVCESVFNDRTVRNGGWNRVGLWDAFDYGERVNRILENRPVQTEAFIPGIGASQRNRRPEIQEPVNHDDSFQKGGETPMAVNRIVCAKEGSNVFLRPKKSTEAGFLTRVPVGETVQVDEDDGTWSHVRWHAWSGYMMSRFLYDPDA